MRRQPLTCSDLFGVVNELAIYWDQMASLDQLELQLVCRNANGNFTDAPAAAFNSRLLAARSMRSWKFSGSPTIQKASSSGGGAWSGAGGWHAR